MKIQALILTLSTGLLLSACQNKSDTDTLDMGLEDPFVSDVVGVQEKHLSPAYWIKPGMDKVILNSNRIKAFNKNSFKVDPTLHVLADLPKTLSKAQLTQYLRSVSKVSKYKRIYSDGTPVTDTDFARYESLLNLEAISAQNPVRFALVVRRTSLRTYPTADLLFSQDATDRDIERFQETALFPGEKVAILHTSTDGKWALVMNYNYIAWAKMSDLAIDIRRAVLSYNTGNKFLVVTGAKVRTVFNPEEPRVSELQLDMGTRLPLDRPDNLAHNLYGQNPYLSHMVLLPVREADGTLAFKHALIQRNKDVHIGYLPYSEANIIRQAFKFLGERYGWGHRFNGRDCTGFVGEVYKTFGILLPRNSGDQAKSEIGINTRFDKDAPLSDKMKRANSAHVGDLVYIPGHVMMILGQSGGEPFVIHDVHGMGYLKPDGSVYKGVFNQVSLSPLLPLQSNSKISWLARSPVIKSVR